MQKEIDADSAAIEHDKNAQEKCKAICFSMKQHASACEDALSMNRRQEMRHYGIEIEKSYEIGELPSSFSISSSPRQ